MDFKNEAKIHTPETDNLRAAIEHRATWLALIFDEGRKAGVENIEEVLRAAVRRCGHIHGARFHENMTDKTNLCQMCPQFLTPAAQLNFEQQVMICTHDELAADFHYCPFVTAFKKLDMSDEDIALLCDIAMEGDRGVGDAMGAELAIPKRISEGDDCCQIHYTRK